MKRFPLILILLFSLPSSVFGEWVNGSSLEELVCDSDLIVVGTLSSVNEYSKNGIDYAEGMITVAETIWRRRQPGRNTHVEVV